MCNLKILIQGCLNQGGKLFVKEELTPGQPGQLHQRNPILKNKQKGMNRHLS